MIQISLNLSLTNLLLNNIAGQEAAAESSKHKEVLFEEGVHPFVLAEAFPSGLSFEVGREAGVVDLQRGPRCGHASIENGRSEHEKGH